MLLGRGPGAVPIGRRPLPAGLAVDAVVAIDASDVRYRVAAVSAATVHVEMLPLMDDSSMVPMDVPGPRRSVTRLQSTDGVDLPLYDLGGTGPAVLVVHATGFHGLCYAPFAAALADRHHVFAIDVRGHGSATPPASGDFVWSGMGDDVQIAAAAIQGMVDSPIFAVGHSMGGASIAIAERAQPGLFRAAWMFEPIIFPADLVTSEGSPLVAIAAARRAEFPSRQSVLDRYGSRPPLDDLRPDALAAYVQHGFLDATSAGGTVRLACEPEHESATFAAVGSVSTDDVAAMDLPIMVGIGRDSDVQPPAMAARALGERCPNVTPAEHPDLGHFGHLEAPDRLAVEAAAFFARHARPDPRR